MLSYILFLDTYMHGGDRDGAGKKSVVTWWEVFVDAFAESGEVLRGRVSEMSVSSSHESSLDSRLLSC